MTDAELERWRGNIETRLAALEALHTMSGAELRERGTEIRDALGKLQGSVSSLEQRQEISAALTQRTGNQVRWLIAALTVAVALAGVLSKVF